KKSSSTTTTSPLSKLESNVRETMKKAFWNILEEQLAEQPPNYQQAISLLNEIKETLLLFLMPQHVQLKNEIDEILDIELIKQKVENGIFDFQRYSQYILSVCSRLCCPVRDEMIKKLTEIKDMIPLFKGIFELLEVMRLDFANFYIQQFRPHIQLASVEYEREKFKNLIEAHQKYQIDVLEYTSKWIRRNYECLDLSHETDMKNYSINDEQKTEDDYPETLLLIRNRIDLVRTSIEKALNDYQAPGLSETKLDSLKYQINELSTPGNRIRSVMERRILEFIERVIQSPSSQTAAPIQVPSGLSTFANELIQIASEFTRLVSYNRAVYSPYYTKIIAEIAGPTHFIPQNELKTIEKSFYG
ncbi:T-complex protein 11, partial [Dermatophagoides pteronyssinus]